MIYTWKIQLKMWKCLHTHTHTTTTTPKNIPSRRENARLDFLLLTMCQHFFSVGISLQYNSLSEGRNYLIGIVSMLTHVHSQSVICWYAYKDWVYITMHVRNWWGWLMKFVWLVTKYVGNLYNNFNQLLPHSNIMK